MNCHKVTRQRSLNEAMKKTSAFLSYEMNHIEENKYYCTYSQLFPPESQEWEKTVTLSKMKYLQFSNLNVFKEKNILYLTPNLISNEQLQGYSCAFNLKLLF